MGETRLEASDEILKNMRSINACFYAASWTDDEGRTTAAVVATDDSIYAERLLAFLAALEAEENAVPAQLDGDD